MRTPTPHIDYTDRDYEAFREMLIDKLTQEMPEYTDTSQTDAGITILEGLADGLDILSMYQDIIANDLLLETTQDRRIAVLLARMLGYTPYNQTSSITSQVFVLTEPLDYDLVIGRGTVLTTAYDENTEEEPMQFETVEDLVIPAGALGNEQDENNNYIYSVDVQQGETIENDLLGSSNGNPYQDFMLSYQNVLVDTLEVYVENSEGEIETWNRVDTFIDSDIDEESRVYTVNVDDYNNCTVEFGDGVRGKIPEIVDNGIEATYRVGGGKASNVQANTITEMEDDIDGIESTFNPDPSYELGHDKEPIEEIKVNAPASFRVRDRAVTLQDYGDLLMIENNDFFYIWKAKAVQNSFNALKADIYYQTRPGYPDTLDQEAIDDITEFLNARRMIGTLFSIQKHTTTVLVLAANLIVSRDYFAEEVEEKVLDYVENTFFAEGEFTFDDDFAPSELEADVMDNVDGIRSFRITSPEDDIIEPSEEYSILSFGSLTLTTTGGRQS